MMLEIIHKLGIDAIATMDYAEIEVIESLLQGMRFIIKIELFILGSVVITIVGIWVYLAHRSEMKKLDEILEKIEEK